MQVRPTRRRLLIAAGLAALAAPLRAAAQQQGKLWRIGFMGSGSHSAAAKHFDALRAALRDLGYVEGKNLVIEARWAEGKFERLPGFAAELLRL